MMILNEQDMKRQQENKAENSLKHNIFQGIFS